MVEAIEATQCYEIAEEVLKEKLEHTVKQASINHEQELVDKVEKAVTEATTANTA